MRYVLVALSVIMLAVVPSTAHAQAPACPPGVLDQRDMQGVYVDVAIPMRVQIYPCGGATILWDNAYGRHTAVYASTERLVGGGLIARGYRPDPSVGYLDDASTIGLKPGTPGTLEVITASPYGQLLAMYRLSKTD